MSEATFTNDQSKHSQLPDVHGHLNRLKSDYRLRHEIRREMLGAMASLFTPRNR